LVRVLPEKIESAVEEASEQISFGVQITRRNSHCAGIFVLAGCVFSAVG
jgi:hypothetical protein